MARRFRRIRCRTWPSHGHLRYRALHERGLSNAPPRRYPTTTQLRGRDVSFFEVVEDLRLSERRIEFSGDGHATFDDAVEVFLNFWCGHDCSLRVGSTYNEHEPVERNNKSVGIISYHCLAAAPQTRSRDRYRSALRCPIPRISDWRCAIAIGRNARRCLDSSPCEADRVDAVRHKRRQWFRPPHRSKNNQNPASVLQSCRVEQPQEGTSHCKSRRINAT